MLLRFVNRLQPACRACRTLRFNHAVNASKLDKESDSFDSFLDDVLHDAQKSDSAPQHKLKGLYATTKSELFASCKTSPPRSAEDFSAILAKLTSLVKNESDDQHLPWLSSEAVVSGLHAQLLSEDASPSYILTSLAYLLQLSDRSTMNDTKADGLMPCYSVVLMKIIQKVDTLLDTKLTDITPSSLITLANAVCDSTCTIVSEEFQSKVASKLSSKVEEIMSPSLLLSLLHNGRIRSDPIVKQKLDGKVDELLPIMTSGELVSLLSIFAEINHRNLPLLNRIAESIRTKQTLSANQICRVLSAMASLSFFHNRLLLHVQKQTVQSLHEFNNWRTFTNFVHPLARLKVTDPDLWLHLCNWISLHSSKTNLNLLSMAISSCATVNVPPELLELPIKKLSSNLRPSNLQKPSVWLNVLHSLSIFGQMPTKLGETVLDNNFIQEILKGDGPDALAFYRMWRLLQVASSLRYDNGQTVRVPTTVINIIKNKDSNYVSSIRHTSSVSGLVADFTKCLAVTADLKTQVIPAHIQPDTGAYVDAMLWVDQANNKVLNTDQREKPNASPVALILATDQLTTKDDGRHAVRLIGELAMNCRHLVKAGIRPVVIQQAELNNCKDRLDRVKLVRDRLFDASPRHFTPTAEEFKAQQV